jgi:hypothetical protein
MSTWKNSNWFGKKIKHRMERKDTITKKAWKKQANFENKGAFIAWVIQEEDGVPIPCNVEIE